MNPWLWVPTGIALWTGVSIALGLVIGRFLALHHQGPRPPAADNEEEPW